MENFLDLRMALLYGGVKYGKQLEQLKNEPDVVVATPDDYWTI